MPKSAQSDGSVPVVFWMFKQLVLSRTTKPINSSFAGKTSDQNVYKFTFRYLRHSKVIGLANEEQLEFRMLLKFSYVVILVALCAAAKKPSFIKRCKSGDVDCIVEVINDIIENHLMEFPKLGLPSYDPWIGGNLTVGGSENSGISVNMHLTDREVRGLSSMKFTRAVGWTKNIRESKIELYGHDNLLNLTGRYSVNGQIASLPILGNGYYEMLLEDVSLQLKIKPDIYLKDGKRHIKIKQIKIQIDPTKFHIELTNLFDGNEELSKALLDGINENWRDAWDELEPTLLPISEEVIKNMLQSIFDLYPYEEFFLPED